MTCTFQNRLESSSGIKLKLKINDNRSTMLSVKWEPDCARVSLHRMFLEAPQNIMDSLACYLRREDKIISSAIRNFIENSIRLMDYSHELNRSLLYSRGHVYDLKKIYNDLNAEYFNNKLDLSITWFGKDTKRSRSRVTFGLYYDPLRLIKINRMLDSFSFPDYFISYVVYHEMLHHVCPSYFDENGQHHIHTKEFKLREMKFSHFAMAQRWIKDNKTSFFL